MYQLAMWTFVIAGLHFTSEMFVFKTVVWNRASAGPLVISTLSLSWMITQWDAYVK